jgi:RNA polymerase sigma-70 factor (ECF subfamily)
MPGQTPDPDPELIRRWQRGDREAFEQIVRHWHPRVARFLARLVGCPELARDLAQEVFLRVYLSAGKYRENGHFPTWLFQIALNQARDAARRSTRRPTVPLADAEPPAPEDDRLYAKERAGAVAASLAELSDPLREVVVLRHYEDMSFEAMARLLGTPASTLKSRFTVAMTRLRETLTARGLLPEETR